MAEKTPIPPDRFDDSLVWMPPEFASAGLDAVRDASSTGHKSLDIGVPELSSYFAPTRAGTLCGLQGQTSHGKSLFLHYLEHQYANQLAKENRSEFIVHVSVEESIEDMAMLELARSSGEPLGELIRGKVRDWPGLEAHAVSVAGIPIVYLGDSADPEKRRPGASITGAGMTLSAATEAITRLEQTLGRGVASMSFDYLQAFPIDYTREDDYQDQRRLQVRSDVYTMRRAANYFGSTVWVAVQSKQELRGVRYDRTMPTPQIPGVYDGEETSAIAQRLDRYLSVWMPARSYPLGTQIQVGPLPGDEILVEENQLFVKVLKQRGGLPSGRVYRFELNFNTGNMKAVEYYG